MGTLLIGLGAPDLRPSYLERAESLIGSVICTVAPRPELIETLPIECMRYGVISQHLHVYYGYAANWIDYRDFNWNSGPIGKPCD